MDVHAVAHHFRMKKPNDDIIIEHVTTYRDAVIIIYRIPGVKQKIAYCYDFSTDDDTKRMYHDDPATAASIIYFNELVLESLPDRPSQNLGVDDIEWFGDKYNGPDIRI